MFPSFTWEWIIIPSDELMVFRRVGIPPTSLMLQKIEDHQQNGSTEAVWPKIRIGIASGCLPLRMFHDFPHLWAGNMGENAFSKHRILWLKHFTLLKTVGLERKQCAYVYTITISTWYQRTDIHEQKGGWTERSQRQGSGHASPSCWWQLTEMSAQHNSYGEQHGNIYPTDP